MLYPYVGQADQPPSPHKDACSVDVEEGCEAGDPNERFLIGDLAAAHREGWVREFWDLATGKIVHAVVIYEMQAEEEPQAIDVSRRSVGA